jgi:GNAT superfamily N-acetyltransferase
VVSVRSASVEDARAIADVHTASWRVTYRGLVPDAYLDALTADDRLAAWIEWLTADPPGNGNQALVVEVEGGLKGFATICSVGPSPPELGALYVDPSFCGCGLGRALMGSVVERVRAAGYSEMVLWVHPENARARRFYERAGWTDDEIDRVVPVWGVQVPERRYRLLLGGG